MPNQWQKGGLLPIEPFREWLIGQIERTDYLVVADRLGMNPRQIQAIIKENSKVTVDTVDHCLTVSSDLMLRDLYPEIYEED